MPELPEIETIKQGLLPHLEGTTIQEVIVRSPQLRWPIPVNLHEQLYQQRLLTICRRGKYLLFVLTKGTLIIHLGMSGRLYLLNKDRPLMIHDHVDIALAPTWLLRYNDPRRFGAMLWTTEKVDDHPLIRSIGIEPLEETFTGHYLKQRALTHRIPIKTFIMDSKQVAGIGNIYAAEALFLAGIHPKKAANQLTDTEYNHLVQAIKKVLEQAIKAGGTTLKDYVNSAGEPGYFSQQLLVYGRNGLSCKRCHTPLQTIQLGQRTTVFCKQCQAI